VCCVRNLEDYKEPARPDEHPKERSSNSSSNSSDIKPRWLSGDKDWQPKWRPKGTDFQRLWFLDQKPCIRVSREELAGLALAMGMRLVQTDSNSFHGTGPFGTYLRGRLTDARCRLHMIHQPRQHDHEVSRRSEYSILFANIWHVEVSPWVSLPNRYILFMSTKTSLRKSGVVIRSTEALPITKALL
jgi:hypothetical protein